MKVIAHACGADKFPYLTLEAARHSLELGADYIEMDVRLTKDRVPVINHDLDATRLFGNTSKIAELTAEEFAALRRVGNENYRAHTLEEMLTSGIAPILLHIKEGGEQLDPVLACVREHQYEEKLIAGVVPVEDIARVKAFDSRIRVLAFISSKQLVDELLRTEVDIIRLWEDWVDEETVRRILEAGKQVWIMSGSIPLRTGGTTTRESVRELVRIGVGGILVDRIVETQSYLDDSKKVENA